LDSGEHGKRSSEIRDLMSWKIFKMYFSFIDSQLLYGVEIYGNSCGTFFTKLTTLNIKILRILQNKPYDTRTTDLYRTYYTNGVGTNFGVEVGEARPEGPRAGRWGSWGRDSQPISPT